MSRPVGGEQAPLTRATARAHFTSSALPSVSANCAPVRRFFPSPLRSGPCSRSPLRPRAGSARDLGRRCLARRDAPLRSPQDATHRNVLGFAEVFRDTCRALFTEFLIELLGARTGGTTSDLNQVALDSSVRTPPASLGPLWPGRQFKISCARNDTVPSDRAGIELQRI